MNGVSGGSVDLHLHSTVSDGTDTPEEILQLAGEAGLKVFSLTDHDAVEGSRRILQARKEKDPLFIPGAEFSARDEGGKYHILGYGYRFGSSPAVKMAARAHEMRMTKVKLRLERLEKDYGFTFQEEDIRVLLEMDNPGKPHIGNLMVRYGYASSKDEAIRDCLNHVHVQAGHMTPAEVIGAIKDSGGIPVLAHPVFGSGSDLIRGEALEERIRHLIACGLAGVEAFYSQNDAGMTREVLDLAEKYNLYVTAGSDYHGTNKKVKMGETGLEKDRPLPERMRLFLERAGECSQNHCLPERL